MNIGFDIDDTLTDVQKYNISFCKKAFRSTGKEYQVINEKAGFIRDMYNWTNDEFNKFWCKVKQQFTENLPMRKNAKMVLEALKKQGHTIYIITRRFTNSPYERSKKWLDKHKLPYDKLIVNAGNKLKACKEHHIDLFIDDNIKTCDLLNKNGILNFVMNNPFNKEEHTTSPRVNSLKEFLHIAMQQQQEQENEFEL
jgi:uncharacterized HAD superfamily protein